MEKIEKYLQKNPSTQEFELQLPHCASLTQQDIEYIINILNKISLLSLPNITINERDASALTIAIGRSTTLKKLFLSVNGMTR